MLSTFSQAWCANSGQAPNSKDLPSFNIDTVIETEGRPDSITWDSSGSRLAAFLSFGVKKVGVWSRAGEVLGEFTLSTTWSPGAKLVFVSQSQLALPPTSNNTRSALEVFDLTSKKITHIVDGRNQDAAGRAGWALSIALSPDRRFAAVVFSYGITVFSTITWNPVLVLAQSPSELQISHVTYSHDGALLAFSRGTSITIVNSIDLSVVRTITAFRSSAKECCISSIVFSPDDSKIAAASDATFDGSCRPISIFPDYNCDGRSQYSPIKIFSVLDGLQITQLVAPVWPARSLLWSKQGYLLFLSTGGLHVWSPLNNTHQYKSLNTNSISMALSPDQNTLAISVEKELRLYSVINQLK